MSERALRELIESEGDFDQTARLRLLNTPEICTVDILKLPSNKQELQELLFYNSDNSISS